MKSVIFLDQYASIGGGQVVLLELIRIFKKHGWKVDLAAPVGGDLEKLAPVDALIPIPELKLSVGEKNPIDMVKALMGTLESASLLAKLKNYDLIYVNGPRLAPIVWMSSPMLKKNSVIYHLHLDHSELQKRFFLRVLGSPATHSLIANSPYVLDKLIELDPKIKDHPKLALIPNSLREAYKHTTLRPSDLSRQASVAVIGRISKEKGQDRVIPLAKSHPQVKFYMIGESDFSEPDFLNNLKSRAPENMIWTGRVAHLEDFIRQNNISISIVPSRAPESFGLVAIESMAASCFTLVSQVGELANLSRQTGCWSFEDDRDLGGKFSEIINLEPEEFRSKVKEQFDKTQKFFSPEKFEQSILELVGNESAR